MGVGGWLNAWVVLGGADKKNQCVRLTRCLPQNQSTNPTQQRQAFAMNVSGFHFDVTVTDMAAYDFEGGALEVRAWGRGIHT